MELKKSKGVRMFLLVESIPVATVAGQGTVFALENLGRVQLQRLACG